MITRKGNVPVAFEVAQQDRVLICGRIIIHQFDGHGNHRLFYKSHGGAEWVSAWTGYQAIAVLSLPIGKFAAVTDYYSGTDLPAVFKIVEK